MGKLNWDKFSEINNKQWELTMWFVFLWYMKLKYEAAAFFFFFKAMSIWGLQDMLANTYK